MIFKKVKKKFSVVEVIHCDDEIVKILNPNTSEEESDYNNDFAFLSIATFNEEYMWENGESNYLLPYNEFHTNDIISVVGVPVKPAPSWFEVFSQTYPTKDRENIRKIFKKIFYRYDKKVIAPANILNFRQSENEDTYYACSHNGSSMPGMSGGPILIIKNDVIYFCGIHLGTSMNKTENYNLFLDIEYPPFKRAYEKFVVKDK